MQKKPRRSDTRKKLNGPKKGKDVTRGKKQETRKNDGSVDPRKAQKGTKAASKPRSQEKRKRPQVSTQGLLLAAKGKKGKLSKGKRKMILKKRRGQIKFQKKQGKVQFDLTRLTKKAFDEAGLVEIASPIKYFKDIALDGRIIKNLEKKGITEPTPIQGMSIPGILQGRDVVGIANTGTGKTAAFALPLIQRAHKKPDTRVLIMAPTRELAEQINREVKAFSEGMSITSVVCVGGLSIEEQQKKLKRQPMFVIGTPGRLLDLKNRKSINFSLFNAVVLDEMDRMLDMGFLKDIKEIVLATPETRNTLLFSATMPSLIRELAKQFLKDPLEFTVKPRATSKNVEQDVVRIKQDSEKMEKLHEILLGEDVYRVIIFGRTKRGVEKIKHELTTRGFKAESLHGDKSQPARSRALKRFARDEISVLVATDVAARGLDIPDVTHVINYDIPETYDDYVHRIGRTGRADKEGKALTFVPHDFDR